MHLRLENLTTEHKHEPLGLDVTPRFGWTVATRQTGVEQLSRRIVVSAAGAVVWDSGTVQDDAHVDVSYAGPPLEPLMRYEWRVEVETTQGSGAGSSSFTTGVLTEPDWHGARWITGGDGVASPLLRMEWDAPSGVTSAYLVVAAGGYARARINGEPVEPFVLSPGFTDYDIRVQYVVSDVARLLVPGRNAVLFELGRGFYGMSGRNNWNWHAAPWHAAPCVRALLATTDTHGDTHFLASSSEWRSAAGPTLFDDLYAGEDYDARREAGTAALPGFAAAGWGAALAVAGPRGRLENQRQPPIEVAETLDPLSIDDVEDGVWVASFPRAIAGWAAVNAAGPAGGTVELRYGERLLPDGRVDCDETLRYYAGRFQTDRVMLGPNGAEWEPRFSYKGFQHVEVRAQRLPELTAKVVHTRADRTGRFACSDGLLTRIHDITVDTILNNLHGLPTDTPMYEKNGWTADGMLGADTMLRNLDTHELLAKWATDIADSRHGGGPPHLIAPQGGWGIDGFPSAPWHAALLLVPWAIYQQRGDIRVLSDTWPDMRDYLRYELALWPDGIATTRLGDWVSPDTDPGGANAPEDPRIAATVYLAAMCDAAARIAAVLGMDAEEWTSAARRIRAAFTDEFLTGDSRIRGVGDEGFRQTHAVLSLAFDMIPPDRRPAVAAGLAQDVRDRGDHLWTGALGTKHLLPVLTEWGYRDEAFAVATSRTFPSWGFWIENGATTTWEHWSLDARSRGHYFLGTIDDWLFTSVAGISPDAPGWRRIRFAPRHLDHLEWAEAEVLSPHGRVAARWERDGRTAHVSLSVPVGTEAVVDIGGHRGLVPPGEHRFEVEIGPDRH